MSKKQQILNFSLWDDGGVAEHDPTHLDMDAFIASAG